MFVNFRYKVIPWNRAICYAEQEGDDKKAGGTDNGVDNKDNKDDKAGEIAALRARLAAREKADNDAKAEADAKKKADEGKAAEALVAAEKEKAELIAKLAEYEKRDKAQADEIYKKLDKDAKKRADMVKDKMSTSEYLTYLGAENLDTAVATIPRGTAGASSIPAGDYKPEYAKEIAAALGREVEYLPLAQVEIDQQGNKTTRLPLATFRKHMSPAPDGAINRLTAEEAAARLGSAAGRTRRG